MIVESSLNWFGFALHSSLISYGKLAPLSQPMSSYLKTNRVSFARVFPHLEPVNYLFASSSDWFIALFTSLMIGQSD